MSDDGVDKEIRGMRVVLGSMAAGFSVFGAIALALGPLSTEGAETLGRTLLPLLGLFGLASTAAAFVLPRQRIAALQEHRAELRALADPLPRLVSDYRGLFIVRAGLTEGPGFFALITYLLTGSLPALAAAALVLLLLVSQWPSREKLQAFVDRVLADA
jgi:hypothetical protein